MNQNLHAYPFLISRNRTEDYRTIIAPQFLIDNKISDILAQAVQGELTGDKIVFEQRVTCLDLREIALIYRVVRAEKHHILSNEEGPLRDINGRVFRFIFGVVLESISSKSALTNSLLLEVETAIKSIYSKYWLSQPSTWNTKFLDPFILKKTNEDSDLIFTPCKDLKILDRSYHLWKKIQEIEFFVPRNIEKINYKEKTISAISETGITRLLKIDEIDTVRLKHGTEEFYNAYCSAFHPSEDLIAYGTTTSIIIIRDINTLDEKFSINIEPEKIKAVPETSSSNELIVTNVNFSCDGKKLLIVTNDEGSRNFLIYDLKTKQLLSLNKPSKRSSGAFHPNKANVFASGTEKSFICIHEIGPEGDFSNTIVEGTSVESNTSIEQLVFSTTGKFLVVIGYDKSVQIINVDEKRKIHEIKKGMAGVKSVAFNHDDKLMILGEFNGDAKIYSTETWNEISNPLKHKESILFCSFNSSEKYIYIFTSKYLVIWAKE